MTVKKTHTVLVVDDEPDLEQLVRQKMRREIRSGDFSFVFAHNGFEALDMLRENPEVEMVLSDINMPKMDGLTLLEQIPSVNPHVRAVVVSAYGDMKNIRTAMNRGAFDFVTKPVDFDDLRLTINRTIHHLEMLRAATASREQLVSLQKELDLANRMQKAVLPSHFPKSGNFSVFGDMEPARDVGGDLYDLLPNEDGLVCAVVADVSGKGVPAALFMMSTRTLLRGAAIAHETHGPAEILSEVNHLLCEDNDSAMFVTVFIALYDPSNGEVQHVNGGHNPPVVVHAKGGCDALSGPGNIALGVSEDMPFEEASTTLQPGDVLLIYTDGVTEAENAEGEFFGMERLLALFAEGDAGNAESVVKKVFEAVRVFTGTAPAADDITCLAISRDSDH